MRTYLVAVCLLVLVVGCGPDREHPLGLLEHALVGVPQDGYPNYNERLMLTAINRCRADPNVEGETKAACSRDFSARPPLMRNHNGSRAARFHCANCIINDGGLSHDSYCTLRSDIGTTFEDTCDGSMSCACEPGSDHFSCQTLGGHGTGAFTRASRFGYSASGEVGAAGYGDGWAAVWGWVSECVGEDGHRVILTGNHNEIGLGYYTGSTQCWSRLYFGDTGRGAPSTYSLPAGVHRSRSGSYDFLVNYYDPDGAPDSVNLVLDGVCHPMTLEIGTAENATYKVNLNIGSGCHQYWFLVHDNSWDRKTYPEQGAWGVGSCSDYAANAMEADCEVCTPGESKPCGLGQCQGNQSCNAGGTWDPCDGLPPDPSESCDGEDNDCDGNVPADEVDGDNDGHRICGGDCDDSDGNVHPGASDPCNGVDEACDGIGDEVDGDSDGAMICAGDCDDSDADRTPGAQEVCDGKDNDCDGNPDAGEVDSDSDTYMVCDNDCDDSDGGIHPGATEACNSIDDNCDGTTDEGCECTHGETRGCSSNIGECRPGTQTCEAGHWGTCAGGVMPAQEECNRLDDDCDGATDNGFPDQDSDGYNSCADCNDADGKVHPGAVEACNGEDDDCDGNVPSNESDGDQDGHRTCDNDCDDSNGNVHPNATESCNDIDDNCDGATDEGCACSGGESRSCGSDAGACEPGTQTCEGGAWGDCVGGVSPKPEECNGQDDNCDGDIDEDCTDEAVALKGSCGCNYRSGSPPDGILLFPSLLLLLRRWRKRLSPANRPG